MPVLAARGIVQRFGKQEVLHGVGLGVGLGEILGLLGPSGAGVGALGCMCPYRAERRPAPCSNRPVTSPATAAGTYAETSR